jgi:Uma2 family endonuclease
MTSRLVPGAQTPQTERIPPLENGERLTREEFERRYAAMPHLKKAELIEGVVHVPSPARCKQHGKPSAQITTWLGMYEASTPGVEALENATVRLDLDNEPQPDACLRIDPACGGRSRTSEDDYVEGAPELACEVASSSASYDLHDRSLSQDSAVGPRPSERPAGKERERGDLTESIVERARRSIPALQPAEARRSLGIGSRLHAYRRNGVLEYLVVRMRDRAVDWYTLREGRYVPLEPGAGGILRSQVFPGLWLDAPALVEGRLARVLEVLHEGLRSPEHVEFVRRLEGARRRD